VAALMFVTPKSSSFFNLFGLFGSEEIDQAGEARLAAMTSVMKIDTSNPKLVPVKEYFEVKQTPWLIVLDKDRVAFQEVLSDKSEARLKAHLASKG
jgi:hypothetical protein